MTVFCVIVTYSDRFHLLEQVIRSCINEGVDKIENQYIKEYVQHSLIQKLKGMSL